MGNYFLDTQYERAPPTLQVEFLIVKPVGDAAWLRHEKMFSITHCVYFTKKNYKIKLY